MQDGLITDADASQGRRSGVDHCLCGWLAPPPKRGLKFFFPMPMIH